MTREEAEECLRDRTKVVTPYGLGEVISVCDERSGLQWVELDIDDPKRYWEATRTMYLTDIHRHIPAVDVSSDRVNNNF